MFTISIVAVEADVVVVDGVVTSIGSNLANLVVVVDDVVTLIGRVVVVKVAFSRIVRNLLKIAVVFGICLQKRNKIVFNAFCVYLFESILMLV